MSDEAMIALSQQIGTLAANVEHLARNVHAQTTSTGMLHQELKHARDDMRTMCERIESALAHSSRTAIAHNGASDNGHG